MHWTSKMCPFHTSTNIFGDRYTLKELTLGQKLCPNRPRPRIFFSYDIFIHGSKCQFIDGINLNLTHVCVCCEIIFVFTYIALVVFVYKVKQKIIIQ